MPKITKITVQVKQPSRMNIFVDDKFFTGLDQLYCIQYGLRMGQEVSAQFCEKILKIDQAETVYKKALKLLAIRPQSTFEIRQKLRQREFAANHIEQTVSRLEKNNLLNDDEFAISWIKHRLENRLRSTQHLISELRQKGIAKLTIQSAIEQTNMADQELLIATKLLQAKLRQTKLPINKVKVRGYLSRRGFSYGTILAAEKILASNAEDAA
ncbi:RecX family transcriptional regulator [Patescibacteria group bacterium]|nr:RecX family transcriptional regulator [Patescibacteria group bacterium]